MSKSILIAAAAAITLSTGLTFYTSAQFDQRLAQLTEHYKTQLPENASFEIEKTSDNGLFREDRWDMKFKFEAEEKTELLQLSSYNNCLVLPLYVSCDGEIKVHASEFFGYTFEDFPKVPHALSWQVNLWADSLTGSFSSEAFEFRDEENHVKVGLSSLSFSGDANASYMDSEMSWAGLTFNGVDATSGENVRMELGKASMSGHSEEKNGYFLVGDGTGELSKIVIEGDIGNISLTPVSLDYSLVMVDERKTSISYRTKIGELSMTDGVQSHTVQDWLMAFTLDGLSYENLIALQKANVDGGAVDPNALLDRLGEDNLSLKLDDISLTYNGMPVKVTGDITADNFTSTELTMAPGNITLLDSEVEIKVGQNLTQLFPHLEGQVAQLEQAQFINRDEKGFLQSKLTLKEGLLKANGQLVQNLLERH